MAKSTKHPSHQIVTITPQMAQSWLNDSDFNNRRIEDSRIAKLSSDIKNGKWVFDGTPIRFNGGSNILDGQHRLYAIVRANKSVECLVVRGLETEAKNTIDTGKARNIGDILHFNGHVNTAVLAAASRLAIAYKITGGDLNAWAASGKKAEISNQDILQEASANTDLIKSVQAVVSLRYTKKIVGAAVPSFCYWLFMKCSSQHIADSFLQGLEHGHNLSANSPILILRNALALRDTKASIAGQKRAAYNAALFIKAWNAFRKNEPISVLKYSTDEEYPKPVTK